MITCKTDENCNGCIYNDEPWSEWKKLRSYAFLGNRGGEYTLTMLVASHVRFV